jgi:hypothetical protein
VTETQLDLDALVARYRRLPAVPHQAEIQDLYTDGCAAMLRLEAELLRVKRRLVAAEADSRDDQAAAREAADLRAVRDELDGRLETIRAVVRLLRTALDWTAVSVDSAPAA